MIKAYTNLALAYRKLGAFGKSESVLKRGLKVSPNNKKIRNQYAVIAIHMKRWTIAIKRLEENCLLYDQHSIPITMLIRLAMLYKIVGIYEKSDSLMQTLIDEYPHQIKDDKKGFRKFTLFDNGESRIEYYKKLQKTDKVIITFDSINMVWKNPPFAFKLLSQQDVDIIAVRKRRKKTYQQDLSQEDFVDTVGVLVEGYRERIAYGFSLGAYAALYFSSLLNCRILAISPRLSIHPKYGRKNVINKFDFKHDLSHNYNSKIAPIIVFDPKNTLDNNYVNQELIQTFPEAVLIKIPYGGHGMAPHLLKMGLLKEFVLAAINGEIPKYDRSKKAKSSIYFRLLGQACLNHNKIKWAMNLANRSLEMLPTDKLAIKLKVNILKGMKQYDTAIEYVKGVIEYLPNILDIKVLLIDLYIEKGDLTKAKNELDITKSKFGDSRILFKRDEIIQEKKS